MAGKVFTDTGNFAAIDDGDEILIDEMRYIVTGYERERRFGMDDPKLWVKRAVDTKTGEKKILKLSYFESFETILGGVAITRFRNPDKEGRILELVGDHPHFMHGTMHRDSVGNNIRVLDIVNGPNFFVYIESLDVDYRTYFYELLPDILKKLLQVFGALRLLHANGYNHGDVRNDHIFVEEETGNYVWIDFDYDYNTSENPFGLDIFGLGNILLYSIGKGFHTRYMMKSDRKFYGNLLDQVNPGDFSMLFKTRFMNLAKLYSFIPTPLNNILMHFSKGADIFYETTDEIIEDLNRYVFSDFP